MDRSRAFAQRPRATSRWLVVTALVCASTHVWGLGQKLVGQRDCCAHNEWAGGDAHREDAHHEDEHHDDHGLSDDCDHRDDHGLSDDCDHHEVITSAERSEEDERDLCLCHAQQRGSVSALLALANTSAGFTNASTRAYETPTPARTRLAFAPKTSPPAA